MSLLSLLMIILICFGAAAVGGYFTSLSVRTWYPTLKKPSWSPPDNVFAPVWTILYLMMAVAGWMVWIRVPRDAVGLPAILFSIQLVLNMGWSAFFFGLRRPDLALVEMVFLWVFIAITMGVFWSIDAVPGAFFLPYFLWVSFAAVLNFSIWRLNRLKTL